MQDLATNEPQSLQAPAKPAREPRISKRLRRALLLLESGECATQKAAAIRADMNEKYLSKALQKADVQVFLARRRAENIAKGAMRASRRFMELVDAESEHVAAKVCQSLLETTGDLKASGGGVSLTINNHAGFVIDLSDDRAEQRAMKVIDAAPMTDGNK